MENINDIIIENDIAIWRMPTTEGSLGGTYTGTFRYRCYLNPIQQLQAGREYRSFLGEHAILANEVEVKLAFALTQLKHRIISSPPFWSSSIQNDGMAGNIGDLNIIGLVYDAAIRAETMYVQKINEEREALLEKSIKAGEKLMQEGKKE